MVIIEEEIDLNKELLELCRSDSRLGFHSEAEGYKYFPDKIIWRMGELEKVLKNDIPEIKKQILNDEPLFPGYTGMEPSEPVAGSISAAGFNWNSENPVIPENLRWLSLDYGRDNDIFQWAPAYSQQELYIFITPEKKSEGNTDITTPGNIQVNIEPRRLWPVKRYYFNSNDNEHFKVIRVNGTDYTVIRVPLKNIFWEGEDRHPVRLDIRIDGEAWRPNNPLTSRLMLGNDNPADLGWLTFN